MAFESTGLSTSKQIKGDKMTIRKSTRSVDMTLDFNEVDKAMGDQWALKMNGKTAGNFYPKSGAIGLIPKGNRSPSLIKLTDSETRKVRKFLETGRPQS